MILDCKLMEKVERGMKCCLHVLNDEGESHCDDCPYQNELLNGDENNTLYCIKHYVLNALRLLEEVKPKVYSVGDFYGEDFGYLEYRTKRDGWSEFDMVPVAIGDTDDYTVTLIFRSAAYDTFDLDDMNKVWRVWSNYPTHEQILKAKWDA